MPHKRSAAAKAAYKRRKLERAQTSFVGPEVTQQSGQGTATPGSEVSLPLLADFEANISEIITKKVLNPPRVDGSGLPRTADITAERLALLGEVADVVKFRTETWCAVNKSFIDKFTGSSRLMQSNMADRWTENGFEQLVSNVRADILMILSREGYGEPETLEATSAPPSQLRGRLLEMLCRLSAPDGEPEDVDVPMLVMSGVGVGHKIPLFEKPEVWPRFQEDRPLRKGEPADLKWRVGSCDMPQLRGINDPELKILVDQEISKEVGIGRMIETEVSEAKALTKVSAIYKKTAPGRPKKVRLLSDYRRSGINRQVKCKTTVLLPRLRDNVELIRRAPIGSYIGEFDIKSAFRNLPLHKDEVPYLALLDPRSPGKALIDKFVPFGLLTAPLLYCRLGAALHRLQRRLISVAFDIPIDDVLSSVYVDDSTFVVASVVQLVFSLVVCGVVGLPVEFAKVSLSKDDARVQGIKMNLQEKTISVPVDKATMIVEDIDSHIERGVICTSQLHSLVGKLSWACQIFPASKPSLVGLYSLLAVATRDNLRSVKISVGAMTSLLYFSRFLAQDKCVKILDLVSEIELVTDASLCGLAGVARCGKETYYFQINPTDTPEEWSKITSVFGRSELVSKDICSLELMAVCYGVLILERTLDMTNVVIRNFTDNSATMTALNKWKSSSEVMRYVLDKLSSYAGRISSVHIPGESNVAVDFLSRNDSKAAAVTVPTTWVKLKP